MELLKDLFAAIFVLALSAFIIYAALLGGPS